MPCYLAAQTTLQSLRDDYEQAMNRVKIAASSDSPNIESYRAAVSKASNAVRAAGQVDAALAYADELKKLDESGVVPKGEAAFAEISYLRQRFHGAITHNEFKRQELLAAACEAHAAKLQDFLKSALLRHEDDLAVQAKKEMETAQAEASKLMTAPPGFVPWPGASIEIASSGALVLGVPSKQMDGNHATCCMWVRPFIDGGGERIMFDGNDTIGNDRLIELHSSRIRIAVPQLPLISGKAALPKNSWSHVALVVSESGVLLFTNSCLDAKLDRKVPALESISRITLGRGIYNGQLWEGQFRGQIADVRIWRRSLSAREIRDCMMNRLVSSNGNVGVWPFLNKSFNERDDKWKSRVYGKVSIVDLWAYQK